MNTCSNWCGWCGGCGTPDHEYTKRQIEDYIKRHDADVKPVQKQSTEAPP